MHLRFIRRRDNYCMNHAACYSVLFFAALSLSACSYPNRGKPLERLAAELGWSSPGKAYDSPTMRLGTMPFNVWYSPMIALGINDLGHHAYVAPGVPGNWKNETSRGTLYCAEAGFVDIAHVRNAIDLTRYVFAHVSTSLYDGIDELEMVAAEPDVYRIRFTPPDEWRNLAERQDVSPETLAEVREASIQIAGRIAYLMTTWHEVVTAFGYKGMWVIPEEPSAFSYDDAVSHRIGIDAAMRALRFDDNLAHFDKTVTATLFDTLIELGVLPAEELEKRIKLAEGTWWRGGQPVLRIVDLGMDDEPLVASLVDERLTPHRWNWSGDDRVGSSRIVDVFDVTIELNIFEAGDIYRALNKDDGPIHPRSDFPALRDALRQKFGA